MSLYIPIFRVLNDAGIRYVVVGGLATVLHGYSRLTADIDIVIELDHEHAAKAINVLTNYGLKPRVPVTPADFANPSIRKKWIEERGMQVFSMWNPDEPLISVDIFVEYPIDFDELWNDARQINLGELSIRIASIPHLIEMKSRANRPQDLLDIEKLTAIQAMKGEMND